VTIVLARTASRHPDKHRLEDELLARLSLDRQQTVIVVPHLNDLPSDGSAAAALRQIDGDLVALTWLYPRAAHWILHYLGIQGAVGQSQAAAAHDRDPHAGASDTAEQARATTAVPNRTIHCLDLREFEAAGSLFSEIQRIASSSCDNRAAPPSESKTPGQPETAVDDAQFTAPAGGSAVAAVPQSQEIDDPVSRRWYPVIDFGRCTNCMECIDFCLFGVYGLDADDSLLVENPDNCRKGCPACSRVCPEHAIIFPQHKTPVIAGAGGQVGGLKLDLSQLFGAPSENEQDPQLAEREREQYLQQAGEDGPGTDNARTEEQPRRPPASRDKLDDLIDTLDDLDI
jgi:NAD-dependent dihydropyrimidine dehydrogenase PreA subunit